MGKVKFDLSRVIEILLNKKISYEESSIANGTGTALRLTTEGYEGVVINCYTSGTVNVQGKNSEAIKVVKTWFE